MNKEDNYSFPGKAKTLFKAEVGKGRKFVGDDIKII